MITTLKRLCGLVAVVVTGSFAHAMGPEAVTVKDDSNEYSVSIQNGTVSVFGKSEKNKRAKLLKPEDMTIILYKDLGTTQTILLKAVEPGGSARPKFEGRVADKESSFVGFELKFSMPGKGTKVLRHMPQIPTSPGASK